MRMATLVSSIAMLLLASGAQAHAHLKKAHPTDGAVLTEAPTSVDLEFSEAARVTAAWLQKNGEPRQKITLKPAKPAANISIQMPPLKPGEYTVSWRVLGADGHLMSGALHFKIAPPPQNAQAR